MSFRKSCCSSRAKRSQVRKCRAIQGEFARHFNDFPKMTFASSSPFQPSQAVRSLWVMSAVQRRPAMTTMGVLVSVANGATASAIGVSPKPARIFTLSRTRSSWAMRLLLSGTPPSSRRMSSIFLPATVAPLENSVDHLCRTVVVRVPDALTRSEPNILGCEDAERYGARENRFLRKR